MKWNKIGFFQIQRDSYPWVHSHAQLPTPISLGNNIVRVFFASRTKNQSSHVGFVDLCIANDGSDFTIKKISSEPVLAPGLPGNFDEHGVYPSCVVKNDGIYYLYYIGWNQGVENPLFYASIGLATSVDGIRFNRHSVAPLMARSEYDPCLVTSPHVYLDGEAWRMSYVSGIRWTRNNEGRLQSHYHIKLAEGSGPSDWIRLGRVAIDFQSGETNIARPAVMKFGKNDYRMWYSYVHSSIGKYRIGYAESNDGTNWKRKDHLAGITIGDDFFSQMVCYPSLFSVSDKIFMLYNGDNFGEHGFGVARLSID